MPRVCPSSQESQGQECASAVRTPNLCSPGQGHERKATFSSPLITSELPKHSSNRCGKSLGPIPCPWALLGVRNLPSHPFSFGRREGRLALGYFLGFLNFPLRPSSACVHMGHCSVEEAPSVRSNLTTKFSRHDVVLLSFFFFFPPFIWAVLRIECLGHPPIYTLKPQPPCDCVCR